MVKATWLISQVSTQAHRLLTEKLAVVGARGYHYRLLAALQEFGPASQASLGRRTSMDRGDVVSAINELASRGQVQRAPDPADQRRNVITITPAGTAAPPAARLLERQRCSIVAVKPRGPGPRAA